MKQIVCASLVLFLLACTIVSTPEWKFVDFSLGRDVTNATLHIARADGSVVDASVGHTVRPVEESATQQTIRSLAYWGALAVAGAGALSGNVPVAATGVAASELVR